MLTNVSIFLMTCLATTITNGAIAAAALLYIKKFLDESVKKESKNLQDFAEQQKKIAEKLMGSSRQSSIHDLFRNDFDDDGKGGNA